MTKREITKFKNKWCISWESQTVTAISLFGNSIPGYDVAPYKKKNIYSVCVEIAMEFKRQYVPSE